jgi:Ca2+-binding EF-hand superfamily protein
MSAAQTLTQPVDPDVLFTADQLAEYQEAFDIFDRDGDGRVTLQELEALVHAVGFQPQDNALDRLTSRLDRTGAGKFTFDEFLKVAEHFFKQVSMGPVLAAAFQVFFGDDKRAKVEEVRTILMNYGNPLADAELKQLFWNLDPELTADDLFEIADLVKLMVGEREDDGDDA